jgi:hypothetical protein
MPNPKYLWGTVEGVKDSRFRVPLGKRSKVMLVMKETDPSIVDTKNGNKSVLPASKPLKAKDDKTNLTHGLDLGADKDLAAVLHFTDQPQAKYHIGILDFEVPGEHDGVPAIMETLTVRDTGPTVTKSNGSTTSDEIAVQFELTSAGSARVSLVDANTGQELDHTTLSQQGVLSTLYWKGTAPKTVVAKAQHISSNQGGTTVTIRCNEVLWRSSYPWL